MGADPRAVATAAKTGGGGLMEGFSPVSPPRIFWNSRKRSANGRSLEKAMEEESLKAAAGDNKPVESSSVEAPMADGSAAPGDPKNELSDRRKALFEPLEPTRRGRSTPAEVLLPPPDFDAASYPKGWLVGKKRKLVNVDVVESMRRIAVHEMNRKDREIGGLNEQLEEDAKCLEHLQLQLLEERSKRADVERENSMFQNQITMLMDMLQEEAVEEEEEGAPRDS